MARSRPIAGQRARTRAAGEAGIGGPPAAATKTAPPTAGRRTAVLERPAVAEPRPPEARHPRWGDWSARSKAVLAVVAVMALMALAAAGLAGYRLHSQSGVESARSEALAAAEDHAVDILSYDYRHLDADFAAGRRTLTGSFARDYAATTSKVVRPSAEQYKAVVKAEVAAGSIVSATSDRVVVLLFVNQTTTSTRLDGPKVDLNRVRLTLDRASGTWLVSNVEAL